VWCRALYKNVTQIRAGRAEILIRQNHSGRRAVGKPLQLRRPQIILEDLKATHIESYNSNRRFGKRQSYYHGYPACEIRGRRHAHDKFGASAPNTASDLGRFDIVARFLDKGFSYNLEKLAKAVQSRPVHRTRTPGLEGQSTQNAGTARRNSATTEGFDWITRCP